MSLSTCAGQVEKNMPHFGGGGEGDRTYYLWNAWCIHVHIHFNDFAKTRQYIVLLGNLPACPSNEFLCDGMCQPDFWKCDGEPDCGDGVDELGCGEFSEWKVNTAPIPNELTDIINFNEIYTIFYLIQF